LQAVVFSAGGDGGALELKLTRLKEAAAVLKA
jgi:hypothetical protein